MYEISKENQDYKQKWLEVERDLALMGIVPQSGSPNYGPIVDVDKDMERVNKRNLEDYQPGASRALVLDALKKEV